MSMDQAWTMVDDDDDEIVTAVTEKKVTETRGKYSYS